MPLDIGVLKNSVRYYHDPDAFTASYLYYIPHAGNYCCNEEYEVEREYLDVSQFIIVDYGVLCVEYEGRTVKALPGTMVLLDCRKPHKYYSLSKELKFRWFHFIGNSSEAYTQLILNTHGFVFTFVDSPEIYQTFQNIMMAIRQETPNCHALSFTINKLLALLMLSFKNPEKHGLEQVIQESAAYIDEHYADKAMSVDDLARRSVLSTCYYMRKFKEYQSVTPHQYVKAVRLRNARQLLSTTSLSIEEIAERCGFSNASHFIKTFRDADGLTPLQFRNLWK